MKTIRIGCGAGYSGDRIEPAVELATRGDLDYLVFECLAERTIGIAQEAKAKDPAAGYDPLLLERMAAVLPACAERGIRILTNMGAANPAAAASAVCELARSLGHGGLTVAAVTGDDVLEVVRRGSFAIDESGEPAGRLGDRLVSANAYLGAEPLVEALSVGADVIIAGRVADPSLFVAPPAFEFGWSMSDWPRLGRGTLAGHLLECGGQVTGGYFADPGVADVGGLARLGFPLAELDESGDVVITKVAGSGGAVTVATCTEQLLYEIQDPSAYLTPDVTADFSRVEVAQLGPDRVRATGAGGRPRPEMLKVSLGYRDGFIGEGQISYAGPGALERGRLALAIVEERFRLIGLAADSARFDLIGVNALAGTLAPAPSAPPEVRARVVAHTATLRDAARVGNEVEALYTNGPAGGGGVTRSVRDVLAIVSTFIPRDLATARVAYERA